MAFVRGVSAGGIGWTWAWSLLQRSKRLQRCWQQRVLWKSPRWECFAWTSLNGWMNQARARIFGTGKKWMIRFLVGFASRNCQYLPIVCIYIYIYHSWMNFFNKNLARALFARNFEDIFVLVACPDRAWRWSYLGQGRWCYRSRHEMQLYWNSKSRSEVVYIAIWIGWHWQNNHKPDGESGNHWWN